MAINGKAKGNSNEREVAKILTKWSGYEFNRVPQSGGLRWEADNNVTGDIVPPFDLGFPISIECKKVETDWELDKLLIGTSEIWKWWKQACRDASRYQSSGRYKEPWLVFTKNYRKHHIMLRELHFMKLCEFSENLHLIDHIYIQKDNSYLILINFENFLNTISFDEVMELTKLTQD